MREVLRKRIVTLIFRSVSVHVCVRDIEDTAPCIFTSTYSYIIIPGV